MQPRAKSYQPLPASDTPGFDSLLWDNFKTTAYFGSMVPGIAPILCCSLMAVEETAVGASCGQGIALALFGLPMGALFSLPFTIAAKYTRQFKPNTEIDPLVNLISSCTNEVDQRYIIKQIVANNTFHFGYVRSLESHNLLSKLDGNSTLEDKWQALLNYLNEKSFSNPEAYVHNGKRTFNSILNIGESIQSKLRLRQAIMEGSTDILNEFSPQDLLKTDWRCKDALHWAITYNRVDLIPYLFGRLSEQAQHASSDNNLRRQSLFLFAGATSSAAMISELLKHTSDNDRALYTHLALRGAAMHGRYEVVRDLIETDNNLVNFQGPGNYTPLMEAACNGHQAVVELLLSKQAAVDAKTLTHKTALQFADENGHKEISRLLLTHGAADTFVNDLRSELKRLIPIIFNHRWSREGWGFLQNHLPDNVEHMRNTLRKAGINLETIDSISRVTVLDAVKALKQFASTANSNRSPNTTNLYNLVRKLGQTTQADFDKLNAFIIPPMQISPCSYKGH